MLFYPCIHQFHPYHKVCIHKDVDCGQHNRLLVQVEGNFNSSLVLFYLHLRHFIHIIKFASITMSVVDNITASSSKWRALPTTLLYLSIHASPFHPCHKVCIHKHVGYGQHNRLLIQVEGTSNNSLMLFNSRIHHFIHIIKFASISMSGVDNITGRSSKRRALPATLVFFYSCIHHSIHIIKFASIIMSVVDKITGCSSKWRALPTTLLCFSIHAYSISVIS